MTGRGRGFTFSDDQHDSIVRLVLEATYERLDVALNEVGRLLAPDASPGSVDDVATHLRNVENAAAALRTIGWPGNHETEGS
jgi:hypothetical protein